MIDVNQVEHTEMACTGSREGEQSSHSTLSAGYRHRTLPRESTSHLRHHWQKARGVSEHQSNLFIRTSQSYRSSQTCGPRNHVPVDSH